MKTGKSSVYQIRGTSGSRYWHEAESGFSAKEAYALATQWNRDVANRLGITPRKYHAETVGREGWFAAGRSGQHGKRI